MKTMTTPDSHWQRIWFAVQEREWTSLVLIPSHAGVDVARVAEMLATTGRLQGGRPVTVVNAIGMQIGTVGRTIDSLNAAVDRGDQVLVPVDPLSENPASIGIVRATGFAALVVQLGESEVSVTRDIVELIGRERILGSIVLDASGKQPAS